MRSSVVFTDPNCRTFKRERIMILSDAHLMCVRNCNPCPTFLEKVGNEIVLATNICYRIEKRLNSNIL